jgi:hypothetical protein
MEACPPRFSLRYCIQRQSDTYIPTIFPKQIPTLNRVNADGEHRAGGGAAACLAGSPIEVSIRSEFTHSDIKAPRILPYLAQESGITPWLQTYERTEIKISPLQSGHSHRASFSRPLRISRQIYSTLILYSTALSCTCTFIHFTRAAQLSTVLYLCPSAGQDVENSCTRQITFPGCSAEPRHLRYRRVLRIWNSNVFARSDANLAVASDRTSQCHIFPITPSEGYQLGSKALHVELTSCILLLTCPSTDTHLSNVVVEVSKECQINK